MIEAKELLKQMYPQRIKTYYPESKEMSLARFDAHEMIDFANAFAQSKWISVEDELPEFCEPVFFWHEDNGRVLSGILLPDGFHSDSHPFNATHWQPLPAPPTDKI